MDMVMAAKNSESLLGNELDIGTAATGEGGSLEWKTTEVSTTKHE